jgi:hypothetical protein
MGHTVSCFSSAAVKRAVQVRQTSECTRDRFGDPVDHEILLRVKILNDLTLHFVEKTIVILYAPPKFSLREAGEYTSKKVALPLVDLQEILVHNFDESNSSSKENLQSVFEYRVSDAKDLEKGFVILNYPATARQLRDMKELLPSFVIEPIFLDLDSDVS